MKAYLSTLNEREKWMLIGTVLCLFLYIYYLFLYSPLSQRVTQKSTQLVEKTATLDWMQKIRQQSRMKQTKKKTVDNSQLLTTLATHLKNDQTLKFPYQLQQTGSGDIQLTFDAVAFNLFITWLEKINQHYAITVKQFEAERSKTSGITRLMILISSASETT
ncbi:GspM family type II secretion system protein LspM [Legionella anisa]|uniref:General secretion pathway protein GspM n=1 Tax=Legionella anisa TaxID=28082 RepID=A0AAX0WT35_9GAMM|nr:GspM family type II secretion system protein LspM [Legionella anisa]AWN74596.1 general secretion pathway protein GspM [Legionella anisa]KTC71608.1 general secretion pathway protein [Legionella anisa]MBN5937543.1 GspM family type II secretion system protein LspM [Legionella anisa]MCW8425290.1 GspM family type II secretion system protein LspM [Legionella anisa]MCW8449281.1 GspM family type II secretion system protein LspM [Legionella anisa]